LDPFAEGKENTDKLQTCSKMLAAAASASRHLLQRDASIGACSSSGNRVRSLFTVSVIATTYPSRTRTCCSHGYGISFNAPKHRACPGLLFAVKGFLSDSSNSNSPHGRVPRPHLPHPVSPIIYFFLWGKT